MSFEGLLNDLEELKKSQAADDGEGDKVIAAAAESDEDQDEGDEPVEGDEGEELGKSMQVTLADGTEVKAMDATVLIKSLRDDVSMIKSERAAENMNLSKSLLLVTEMLGEQGKTIKALSDQVAKMANQGAGRKAVVAVGTDLAKSEGVTPAVSNDDLMSKCLSAQAAGKISGFEISLAESCINRGLPIPDSVRGKLL